MNLSDVEACTVSVQALHQYSSVQTDDYSWQE